jgi:ribose transport system permease protein
VSVPVSEDAVALEQGGMLPRIGRGLRASLREMLLRAYRGENSAILIVAMFGVIAVFAALLSGTGYLSLDNFIGIVRQTTVITILAIATVFVISAGEIDLSIGAVIPIGAYALALLLPKYGEAIAILGALACGAVIGLVNGLITVKLHMPSFVVTLGMLGFLQGLSRIPTNSLAVVVDDRNFTLAFGSGTLGHIPVLLLWTAGAALIGYILLGWTSAGKAVLATGANPAAARFSGIRTDLVKVMVLVASGMAGALGGILYVGQYHGARYDLGSTDLLTVIAAAIIGGTALAGGRGSVIGAVVGSLLLGAVNNGLIILGLDVPQQLMFRGGIIIAAVVLSSRARVRRG